MNSGTIRLLSAAIALVIAFIGGCVVESWCKEGEIANLKTAQQTAISKVGAAALVRISTANKRGDALSLKLSAAESAAQKTAEEHQREIKRLTTGRPCLGGAVVSLLNQSGASVSPRLVSQAASQPVRPDAGFATDTDVALWADQCRRGYDTCRGRLQAIADFYQGEDAGE